MRVLVAGPGSTGALPGEMVQASMTCARDQADGSCGCGTTWVGLSSRRYCTEAVVAERPITLATLTELVVGAMRAVGWHPDPAGVALETRQLAAAVEDLPVGTTVTRDAHTLTIHAPAT